MKLKLESWSALAPGMEDIESWRSWFQDGAVREAQNDYSPSLKAIPPLLRRRFSTLGKYAARAALNLRLDNKQLATVFASRHGDTPLTLSLLEEIGRDQPLSPTGFSLAVHNAVGGLLSIAKKDQSAMTAIASTENLVLSTFHEAVAQLQSYKQVLCVVYDVPLPDLYTVFSDSLPFPIAISFVLTRETEEGSLLTLEQSNDALPEVSSEQTMIDLVAFLSGCKQQLTLPFRGRSWLLSGELNV
ncbi:beta-ketoacyl synthase chain length factor [uncultured Methylophaga sp.]|uniref:beta-ketoacyl synthase chain length factor n=1 Tax=uncultured Methylophaga sp. TaxID=285271 RepID=UPI0026090F09|nr:beta-ketoacyl synthase chain length factor [uncultured Methylophaga sp.]